MKPPLFWSLRHFDPTKEYFKGLRYEGKYTDLPCSPSTVGLHESARRILPEGLYYEIRASIPTNFGRDKSVYWNYTPNMKYRPFRCIIPVYDSAEGYFFIGGYLA